MKVIIEDYVHGEIAKLILIMANAFFAIAVGLACASPSSRFLGS